MHWTGIVLIVPAGAQGWRPIQTAVLFAVVRPIRALRLPTAPIGAVGVLSPAILPIVVPALGPQVQVAAI